MADKKQFSVTLSYDVQKTFIVEAKDEDEIGRASCRERV